MGMFENASGGKQGLFWFVFLFVAINLVGLSYLVITFIWGTVQDDDIVVDDAISAIYVNYITNPDDYISSESYIAMAEYQQQFPETQNVQVLQSLDTVEIIGYMINHLSGGMGVDCTYCHSLANFAADEWDDPVAMENKNLARQHLLMTQDLNRDWLANLGDVSELKQPSGAQITCAICHNGEPAPQIWAGVPDYEDEMLRLMTEPVTVENEDVLNVNARSDISLETVQYNQNVMYHMNTSMNVGCTHCHNSRYFPSWEVPAKYYSVHMVQMTQDIYAEYGETLGGQTPSCHLCHQGAVIPPGSARSVDVLPADLVPVP